jgi:peptidoglycan hydrolase-like protein with peptidoglycan-binding domain/TPR repeat protein
VSRSSRAWAKGCELAGAAVRGVRRLGKLEERETLEAERLVRTRSSLATLTWVAAAVMLMVALNPALALGKSASRGGRTPAARAGQGTSHTRVTRADRSADPPHVGGPVARTQTGRVAVLAFGSGYASAHGSRPVRALQRRLAGLGYSPGPIDGRFGPRTEAAVTRFQVTHGLVADGVDGPLTRAALASARLVLYPGDGYVPGGSGLVRGLQRHLAAAGFRPGPIDGRYGPLTERAVIRFQTARHLLIDGIAGPQTLGHLAPATRPPALRRPHVRPAPRPVHPRSHPPATRARRAPAPKTARHTRHSTTSPVPWVIVLVLLSLAMFVALYWRQRRRHDRLVPAATADTRAGRADPTTDQAATTPRESTPEESLPLPGPSEPVPGLVSPQEPGPLPVRQGPPLAAEPGRGALKLARLLAEAGNLRGAEDAFRRAHQRGHPTAAFELGVLLARQGDRVGSVEAFREADQRGHPEAAFNLGVLLIETGDPRGAQEAFGKADDRGDADAAYNVGVLLEEQGDLTGAQLAYRRADRRGHPAAAFNLGVLLLQAGDHSGAEDAFTRGDDRGLPEAACNLGVLLEHRGDPIGAEAAYRRADERGHAVGAWNLGSLLEQQGDRAGAKAAYQRADERGHAAGACNLGLMLKDEGDRTGALRAFERAGEHGPPEVAELAYAALRELRADEDDEDDER